MAMTAWRWFGRIRNFLCICQDGCDKTANHGKLSEALPSRDAHPSGDHPGMRLHLHHGIICDTEEQAVRNIVKPEQNSCGHRLRKTVRLPRRMTGSHNDYPGNRQCPGFAFRSCARHPGIRLRAKERRKAPERNEENDKAACPQQKPCGSRPCLLEPWPAQKILRLANGRSQHHSDGKKAHPDMSHQAEMEAGIGIEPVWTALQAAA